MDTSIPSSKVASPEFTTEESKGLQDYWGVYEEHRQKITSDLVHMAGEFPEFRFILQNSSLQPTPEQQKANIEKQQRAIYQGEWEPYIESLWEQGNTYARAGLSFHAWIEITGAFRKLVRPYLLDAFGDSPERLFTALQGADRGLDHAADDAGATGVCV